MKRLAMLVIAVTISISLNQSVSGKESIGSGRNKCGEVQPSIRSRINAGKCPGWVPWSQCLDWNGMARAELELHDIFCSREKIYSVRFDKKEKILTTTLIRHTVIVQFIIDDLKFVESVALVDSRMKIKYTDKFTPALKFTEKAKWFGYGTVSGVILTGLIILFI